MVPIWYLVGICFIFRCQMLFIQTMPAILIIPTQILIVVTVMPGWLTLDYPTVSTMLWNVLFITRYMSLYYILRHHKPLRNKNTSDVTVCSGQFAICMAAVVYRNRYFGFCSSTVSCQWLWLNMARHTKSDKLMR